MINTINSLSAFRRCRSILDIVVELDEFNFRHLDSRNDGNLDFDFSTHLFFLGRASPGEREKNANTSNRFNQREEFYLRLNVSVDFVWRSLTDDDELFELLLLEMLPKLINRKKKRDFVESTGNQINRADFEKLAFSSLYYFATFSI